MTFLNATLMFGIAAIAVPIALHLLARREPRRVVFPSVRFLSKKFESNRNRLRVRKWWLLALRIAALAALAIALARPAIHRSLSLTWLTIGILAAVGVGLLAMASVALVKSNAKGTGYGLAGAALLRLVGAALWGVYTTSSGPAMSIDQARPTAIAIVLDNSPTAAWNGPNDDRMGRMKALATWMVTRLPRTSRIAIVDRSAQVASFSLDVSSAVSRIEQLTPLEVVQPIASRLEVAARLVRTSDLEQRRVLLVTDLATSTWSDAVDDTALATTFQTDPAVALTVYDQGEFSGINRSLTIPRFKDNSPPRGVPVPVSTILRIDGAEADAEISVTAELDIYENDPALPVVRDGIVKLPKTRSVDRTSVKVKPGIQQEILLTIPSLSEGTHHGRIRLIGDDAMPLDDVRYFSLQVIPPSRVLLVGDDEDEARIIRDTIAASEGATDDAESAYAVERIGYQDLAVVRLEDFESLILLDPSREVIADAAVLDYANSGGGVLVCLGPAAGEEPLETSLLPPLVRRWRSPDPGTFFQVVNASHSVTEPLSADTPWSDFRVHQYWQIKPHDDDNVLVQYAGTEHAAVLQRSFATSQNKSSGHLLVVTTPLPSLAMATRKWNDLYGTDPWPAWLMTRKSVEYLTGRGVIDRMSSVGRPILIPIDASELARSDSKIDTNQVLPSRVQLFRPGGGLPIPLNVPTGAQQIAVNDVSRSGTYWVRGLEVGNGFSANLPSDTIQTDRIDARQLDLVFGPDQYSLATSREEIEFTESGAAYAVSLHSPAMLLALAIFLLEQILGNRFYRSPKGLVAQRAS
jgi:hypothetical protein